MEPLEIIHERICKDVFEILFEKFLKQFIKESFVKKTSYVHNGRI